MEVSQIISITLLTYLILLNVITCAIYGIDKNKAIKGKRRISENTLFILAGMGGSAGAIAGMLLFRHKTKHIQFKVGLTTIFLFHVLVALWGFIGKLYFI